jgi:hypothetical protein
MRGVGSKQEKRECLRGNRFRQRSKDGAALESHGGFAQPSSKLAIAHAA